MGVKKEQLKDLTESIKYKYRLQSAKYGKATVVSYVDSRAVAARLDEVVGAENWSDEYRPIDGKLFAGVSILIDREDGSSDWVTKWDVGTESNMDADKGESSDSFKRAAVKWGLGRFLYSLGIITLKTGTHKDKEYPATDEGNILWGVDELTEYCKKVVASGELDRTKKGVKPLGGNATATPVTKVTPTKPVADDKPKTAIQPNTNFDAKDDSLERKAKAKELFAALDQASVLKYVIGTLKKKHTSVQAFIDNEPIELILDTYTKLTAK